MKIPGEMVSRIGRGLLLCLLLLATVGLATETVPPAPAHYFNDYAGVVAPQVGRELNLELEQFEKQTSNQIVVAIFPTMQTDSSLEDYAQRIFQAWKPGLKNLNNGAILLVFLKEHKLRIQTGYGLEGALPDAICKRIVSDEIAPRLQAGDFTGAMRAGVHAMMQAAKGEYKGTGRTVHQQQHGGDQGFGWGVAVIVFVILAFLMISSSRATSYSSSGRRTYGPWNSGLGGGGGFGGGFGGGGSDGGGGFSGGGGDSGGGGASGSW